MKVHAARPSRLASLCLAGTALTLLCAGAAGCDGDDTPPKFFDASTDAPTDAPPPDAKADAPSDASTSNGKIIVVHASPDLGAVGLCFAIGLQNDGSDGAIAPIPPLPKGSPLGPGAGAVLPDLGDLSLRALTVYAVPAAKLSGATCDALLAGLNVGADYFKFGTLKNGTLAASTTHLVALTGCLPAALDGAADPTTCGATWTGTNGNLATTAFALDRVVANTQRFGAEVAHLATPASGVWSALYGSNAVSAALRANDGGALEPITDSVALGALAPSSAASLAMPSVDETSFVVSAVNPDGGAPPVETSVPLPLVYEATTGQATGEKSYFVAGANYTFVFVGDPRAAATLDGGAFNGYALHALAFPNDPPLPP